MLASYIFMYLTLYMYDPHKTLLNMIQAESRNCKNNVYMLIVMCIYPLTNRCILKNGNVVCVILFRPKKVPDGQKFLVIMNQVCEQT